MRESSFFKCVFFIPVVWCVLRQVKKSDEGGYICRASNEGGYTEETVYLLTESTLSFPHSTFKLIVFWPIFLQEYKNGSLTASDRFSQSQGSSLQNPSSFLDSCQIFGGHTGVHCCCRSTSGVGAPTGTKLRGWSHHQCELFGASVSLATVCVVQERRGHSYHRQVVQCCRILTKIAGLWNEIWTTFQISDGRQGLISQNQENGTQRKILGFAHQFLKLGTTTTRTTTQRLFVFVTDRVTYDTNGLLIIREMTSADQGEYDCLATNIAGQGSSTAVLHYIG